MDFVLDYTTFKKRYDLPGRSVHQTQELEGVSFGKMATPKLVDPMKRLGSWSGQAKWSQVAGCCKLVVEELENQLR